MADGFDDVPVRVGCKGAEGVLVVDRSRPRSPVVGAAGFTWLHDAISRLEYWRFILGGTIIGLVLAFPQGLGGIWRQIEALIRQQRATGLGTDR